MNTHFFVANELAALLAAPVALLVSGLSAPAWKARILIFGQVAAFCFAFLGLIWSLNFPSVASPMAISKFAGLNLDTVSCGLLAGITFIAAVVLAFSDRYLLGDASRLSFLRLLTFLSSCAALIGVTDSICVSFVCWSALSLGLWVIMRLHCSRSGAAATVLRYHLLSDLALLASLILVVGCTEATEFSELSSASWLLSNGDSQWWAGTAASLLMVIAFGVKSALFPFHRWLLVTLEAPTPLSGFLHAGVVNVSAILAWRLMPVLHEHSAILLFWGIWSAFSAIVGTLSMSAQPDVKRKLVYSTAGQMGFMSLQCAVGAPGAAIFHLIAHGLFKCQMFLQSGSAVQEGSNIRKFGYSHGSEGESQRLRNSLLVAMTAIGFVCVYTSCIDFDWTSLSAAITAAALLCAVPALNRINMSSLCLFWLTVMALGFATGFGRRLFELWMPADYSVNGWLLPAFLAMSLALALVLHLSRKSGIAKALYVHSLNGFYVNELQLSRK